MSTRAEPLQFAEPGQPSFLARLETTVSGGLSVFSVVETNPFKELTHLSLKFRAGNDAAIKTYLAARLRQVMIQAPLHLGDYGRSVEAFSVLFCLMILNMRCGRDDGLSYVLPRSHSLPDVLLSPGMWPAVYPRNFTPFTDSP